MSKISRAEPSLRATASTEPPIGNAAFTPGPWRLHETERHPWIVECPTTHPDFYGNVCRVGFLPNARLIAAAPELYEAVAEALSHISESGYIPSIGKPATDRLRAALAKAAGNAGLSGVRPKAAHNRANSGMNPNPSHPQARDGES